MGSTPTIGTKEMNRKLDKNFIWNSRIAYAIGLIATDGSLSKDGRHIVLVSTDYSLLEDFQKCLPFLTKISDKPPSSLSVKKVYKVQFSNVQFYRWLLKIGLTPNKTCTIRALKIPRRYYPDFVRGHLDGDGDVINYIDKYGIDKNKNYVYNRLYSKFCSASKDHIVWLRKIIFDSIKVSGSLTEYQRKDRTIPQWRLRFAKKDSIKLYWWLYYNANVFCLKRKKIKFEEVISKIN